MVNSKISKKFHVIRNMYTIETDAFGNIYLNKIFNSFSVFYVEDENFDLNSDTNMKTNLNQSKAIIIQETEKYQKDNIFLICFKNTILLIKQFHLKTLQELIFNNSKLPIFFLTKESQNHFREKVNIHDDQIKSYEYFIDEVNSFQHYIKNILLTPTLSEYQEIEKYITSNIAGYLICESYSKINNDQRNIYSQMIENGLNIKSTTNNDNEIEKFLENDFIRLKIIGIGTFSEVYLSYHIKKRELFAIKRFIENESSKLINREIENYQKIDFHLLPKFCGIIKDTNSIVIQFINGRTLMDIETIKLKVEDKIFIILEMIMIIEYFHQKHFVYRDLKPNNVIVDENKIIYFIDFDRMLDIDNIQNKEENYTVDFSTVYIAPEVNYGLIRCENDIYSLGKMIFYMTQDTSEKEINIFCHKIISKCIDNCAEKRPCIFEIKKEILSLILEFGSKYITLDINKSIYYFSLAANQNDPKAQFNLGEIYSEGKYNTVDINKSIQYYTLAANQNHPISSSALCNLGDIYRKGECVEKNLNKAKEYYELAAKSNNANAFDCLGNIYYKGEGVEKDFNKAKEYYELAAKQDNADAIYKLGYFYYIGRVFEKNIEKAKELFEKAARLNFPPAFNGLGNIYCSNSSVEESVKKGIEYYMKAAELDDSNALLNLGYVYTNGNQFIQKDPSRGLKYFEKAAEKGCASANNAIGNLYFLGIGVEKDYSMAKYYFKKAVKQGCIDAYNALGYIYDKGKGVQINYAKAIKYYEKSAENNNPNSLNNLGNIYLHGNGVPKDYLKAKEYFKRSSQKDNSRAFYLLGNLYYHGLGVERNYLEAKKYYKIAAKKNFSLAIYDLGELYYNGLGVNQDYIKAEKYYKRAHSYRNTKASFKLGIMYYYGKGVQQDYNEAKNYFIASANENDINAFFYLAKMYENGKGTEIKICKAIENYLQCIEKKEQKQVIHYNEGWTTFTNDNLCYYYHAFNNLGLIYLIEMQNIELAEKYIKEAGLNEHPLGQNNLGIFNQFYLDKIDNSIYFYKKAANNHFSLPEFNLGYIEEMKGNVMNSVNYYLKVLQYENETLTFRNTEIDDEFLDYSNLFIVSYTNLKLFKYYLSKNESIEISNDTFSHKFLINAIFRPLFGLLICMKHDSYSFKFVIDKSQANFDADNLKHFFVDFPLFCSKDIGSESQWEVIKGKSEKIIKIILKIESKGNESNLNNNIYNKNEMFIDIFHKQIENIFNGLNKNNTFKLISYQIQGNNRNEITNLEKAKLIQNQIEKIKKNDIINIELKNKNQYNKSDVIVIKEPMGYSIKNSICDEKYKTRIIIIKSTKDCIERIIEYPIELEEVFYQNMNGKVSLIDEVLKLLHDILYTKPYPILFGRIGKMAMNLNNKTENINDSFYDGFNI